MKKERTLHILGRKLATELTFEGLAAVCGRGTSWYPSGKVDDAGRGEDVRSGDCIDGPDQYFPRV